MEKIPKKRTPILVVDDDEGLLTSIKATLVSKGFPEPALVSDSRRVLELVREHGFHLVLLDLMMPHIGGMEILGQLKTEFPAVECMMITAVDEVGTAVKAMKYGAYDYLIKPIDPERLMIVVDHALERFSLRYERRLTETAPSFDEIKHPEAFDGMVASDPAMASVFRHAEVCAANNYNLLITGETGTGKEMLANIIHRLSPRSDASFVAVNMASFNKNLFEDDLFGHVKGAYTGAVDHKKGFFETANGGTLFLDEISELKTEAQAALLRVIEEKELYRLGSTQVRNIDVRILSASNRNIGEEVNQGKFRADLYYRLNTCHVDIPPLRKRKEDILPLARHFLKKHAAINKKNIHTISAEFSQHLLNYPFPGNVRELENIIVSACLTAQGDTLTPKFSRLFDTPLSQEVLPEIELISLAQMEREHIERVMDAAGGNRTQAAKILGISIRTLQRKMKPVDGS